MAKTDTEKSAPMVDDARGLKPFTTISGPCASSRASARPADTNKRFKYLISNGVSGLSTAFDMPALMGYDADHELSRGEVGKEGVAVSTLKDFEILFDGIALDQVTTSMTINASAIVALAMYIAVANSRACRWPSSAAPFRTTCSRSSSLRRSGSSDHGPRCASSST
jgi:methylmalonyl-CoA mutase N-terminal domain/subunit